MNYIHPFPARMAPEIALDRLRSLSTQSAVLDPMCGSGMVLSQSARLGISAIGCDLDPLARLISRVGSTRVRDSSVWNCFDELMTYCNRTGGDTAHLSWIDRDPETSAFVKYWFGSKQEFQLRRAAKFLMRFNPEFRSSVMNLIMVALSRLIVTKEPKASLARDTAHSRPHKTITENDFDVYAHFESSIRYVLKALDSDEIVVNAKTHLADARRLSRIPCSSVDAIISSPPYLNAIDYMRGHKFSLIWFGYNLSYLRTIRSAAIGSEAALRHGGQEDFEDMLALIGLNKLEGRTRSLLSRYYFDLRQLLAEGQRVLKPKKLAVFVIGNSAVSGEHIPNSEILKFAAKKVGFSIVSEDIRKIPDKNRYLPVSVVKTNSLARRMRTEHIIELTH